MPRIRWVKTIEGEPRAYPVRRIVKGEECGLADAQARSAVEAGLAEYVDAAETNEEAPPKKKKRGRPRKEKIDDGTG